MEPCKKGKSARSGLMETCKKEKSARGEPILVFENDFGFILLF